MQPLADEFDSLLWSCSSVTDCCLSCFCPHFYAFFVGNLLLYNKTVQAFNQMKLISIASKAGYSFIGSMMNFCCYPFCLFCLRQHVREIHGIDGGCCGDLTTTLCCPCCGYIQV